MILPTQKKRAPMNERTLIAYFSRKGFNYLNGRIVDLPVGNTEAAARIIQSQAGGDLSPIEPAVPYPADYTRATEVAQQELDRNARPALVHSLESLAGYDVILLGYPNWWGTMPMPVWTFLEAHDFTGKTLLPFCTHEGSGLGQSERDIRKLCPGAQVLPGLAIRGGRVGQSAKVIAAWLKESNAVV
jgi:flavodoxin